MCVYIYIYIHISVHINIHIMSPQPSPTPRVSLPGCPRPLLSVRKGPSGLSGGLGQSTWGSLSLPKFNPEK